MEAAADLVLVAITGGLLFIAWAHLRQWVGDGGRAPAWLAAAFALLSVASVTSIVASFGGVESRVLNDLGLYSFLGSGYAILRHRDALIPMRRSTRILAASGLAAAIGLGLAAPISPINAQLAVDLFQVGVWAVFVGEPAYRVNLLARDRPVVQQSRLRAISLGYACIVVLIALPAVVYSAGTAAGVSPAFEVLIRLPGIPVLVLLYAGFLPPPILRSWWRAREERALIREASPLFFAPDRTSLADRALGWAVRLVGGDRGCLVLPNDPTPTRYGMDGEAAQQVLEQTGIAPHEPLLVTVGDPSHRALVVPLHLESGTGTLIVVAGRFTPNFEEDELQALAHYASSVAVAFDHVKVNEIRKGFLTAVSHEFRTPLTAILGISATFTKHDGSLSEHHRRELIERLGVNASRLDRMLADLLDIERLERGGLHLRPRETDLAEMVRVLLNSVDALRGRVVQFSADQVAALVDPPHAQRAIEHLLVNAVHHTPPETKIWVRVEDGPEGALVIVEDEGEGLPVDVRGSIFEPFRQGPNTRSHSPGIGVGLAYVSRIAELHGGRAWVEERNGGGSSFRVVFPRATDASGGPPGLRGP